MLQDDSAHPVQVAVGCGSVCAFHVGGTPNGEMPRSRWEFFIGDRPHCAGASTDDLAAERQPIKQISSIEHYLDPGEVAVSTEVAQQASPLLTTTSSGVARWSHPTSQDAWQMCSAWLGNSRALRISR